MRYFKESEFNHFDKMDKAFLERVDKFREWHGYPTRLTSDWRDGATSAHGKGLALDMVLFREWNKSQPHWFEIYTKAVRFGFAGVGIYFDWKVGTMPVVGLHVDDLNEQGKRPLEWIRHNGVYYYNRGGFFVSPQNQLLTNLPTQHRMFS